MSGYTARYQSIQLKHWFNLFSFFVFKCNNSIGLFNNKKKTTVSFLHQYTKVYVTLNGHFHKVHLQVQSIWNTSWYTVYTSNKHFYDDKVYYRTSRNRRNCEDVLYFNSYHHFYLIHFWFEVILTRNSILNYLSVVLLCLCPGLGDITDIVVPSLHTPKKGQPTSTDI